MRKFSSIFLCSMLLLSVGSMQAQNAAPTTAPAASSNPDNFADIATLGEEIAVAQRKIQAMTLKNSLEALQAQQSEGTFPFKVLRVEGFSDNLYAVLSDSSGVIYQVGPGDLVGNQYRVSLIRPYSVGVLDVNTQKAYAVPFVIGGASAVTDDSSEPVTLPTTGVTSKAVSSS